MFYSSADKLLRGYRKSSMPQWSFLDDESLFSIVGVGDPRVDDRDNRPRGARSGPGLGDLEKWLGSTWKGGP